MPLCIIWYFSGGAPRPFFVKQVTIPVQAYYSEGPVIMQEVLHGRKPMNRRKKIRRTGEPAAGCKEGKETEREEIVSPPQRMVLAYPENLKSIWIFYK